MRNKFARYIGGLAVALAALAGAGQALGQVDKIADVVFASGNSGQTLSTGYNTIETASVQCKYFQGSCPVSLRIMSSVDQATCQGNWSIVGLVDGQYVDGGPIQDQLPASTLSHTGIWQGLYYAAYGTHTVAFQIYVPCPVTARQWSVRYIVTKP